MVPLAWGWQYQLENGGVSSEMVAWGHDHGDEVAKTDGREKKGSSITGKGKSMERGNMGGGEEEELDSKRGGIDRERKLGGRNRGSSRETTNQAAGWWVGTLVGDGGTSGKGRHGGTDWKGRWVGSQIFWPIKCLGDLERIISNIKKSHH